ncbi:MAG: DUF1211 domain-containing protein [Lautropia sp.]|nr:MAG: DUF1211 domain-containing protein [Pseudomonadota bacterium]MBC6958143.1 DUF1211 domain-containing protein [Lautropia sp.]MCL4700279.1 DUF1211 domain-containing protein [Burkholderiaceae bacterium]MDL1906828.1 DUF1211 domain-containing protein [Betaproteobacteria bacterium PRO1]RIK90722.1 MAG: hypothetical protein DCC70_03040 [Burkholderiales bacterium]
MQTWPTDRAAALSDGLFSIAATLLVIDVRLPPGEETFHWTMLGQIAPRILGYLISFVVIGQLWIAHHRKLRMVERIDARALWLNLLFLMLVAFIPFPTAVLSEHGNRDAVVFYAATIVAASSMLLLLWLHLGRHRDWLVQGPSLAAEFRREGRRTLLVPAVFLLSMPLAWLDPAWAMYSWLLLLPAALLLGRR